MKAQVRYTYNEPIIKDGYTQIPNGLITTHLLTSTEKIVLMFFMSHKDGHAVTKNFVHNGIFITNRKGQKVPMKFDRINDAIKSLMKKRYLIFDDEYFIYTVNLSDFYIQFPKKE